MSRAVRGVPGRDFGVEDVRGDFPDEIEIKPLTSPVDATVRVPGSKSVTNRAVICCALADGESTLRNPLLSDDSFWLLKSLTDLGFEVHVEDGDVHIGGRGGIIPNRDVDIFVGNAGTAARFLPSALALGDGPYRIDGVPRMRERPISDLVDALRSLGAKIDYPDEEGRFPLTVRGGGLKGGHASVESAKSSQFLSGVMLGAPFAASPVTLSVRGDLVSKPYIGITRDVMQAFGVSVYEPAPGSYRIEPGTYRATDFSVEPDASGASYFFAAAALTGGRIRVEGLGEDSSQGDLGFVEVLRKMGCEVEYGKPDKPDSAPYTEVRGPGRLCGIEVDMNDISDTFLTLAAIAPFADSPTTITNIGHTRYQETDRIHAVATELKRLGVEVEEYPEGIHIIPLKDLEDSPVRVATYGDHRVAMSFALFGLMVGGVRIGDPSCVTKTLPDYFERLGLLGLSG